jgi:hypothetical protein
MTNKITVEGKAGIKAAVLKHSASTVSGKELVTFEIEYPRIILSELNTHRCLVAGTLLDFDLPSGPANGLRKSFKMSIKEFHDKWHNGALEHRVGSLVDKKHSLLDDCKTYTAKQIAAITGYSVSNIRSACRSGKLPPTNQGKTKLQDWTITGKDFKEYRDNLGFRSFSLKTRLREMLLRSYNEFTQEIVSTSVSDVWFVGVKPVFKLTLESGKTIRGTDDHPIHTKSGWVDLGALVVGDLVTTAKFSKNPKKAARQFHTIDGKSVSQWNKKVLPSLLLRQDGKCNSCGSVEKLEVHHIRPKHLRPDLAFDEGNAVALCEECHKNEHRDQRTYEKDNRLVPFWDRVVSVEPDGEEGVYDLSVTSDFHNFFANGILVHNCLSKNSASSRAIPFNKMLESVKGRPVRFGQANPGMQDKGADFDEPVFVDGFTPFTPEQAWEKAKHSAIRFSKAFFDAGYHKQCLNRLTEPFQMMKTVISGTEWANFFWLRNHEAADPTLQELACCMQEAHEKSAPYALYPGEWHLPYVTFEAGVYSIEGQVLTPEEAKKVSAARCAAVSFRNTDYTLEKSLQVFERLVGDERKHASAFEHQATPMNEVGYYSHPSAAANLPFAPSTWQDGISHMDKNGQLWSGNFCGFIQHRKLIDGENIPG